MKIVQIISPGHSGSTIADIILGSTDQIISTGELRKLPWQIYRSNIGECSISRQNICTCIKPFNNCMYWSKVLQEVSNKKGFDISQKPTEFQISFFGEFGHHLHSTPPSVNQKIYGKIYRLLLQNKLASRNFIRQNKTITNILDNNWTLFESMRGVGKKNVIVDSSKDIKRALLLHNDSPEQVYFIFLKRNVLGHIASMKRRAIKTGEFTTLLSLIKDRNSFISRTNKTMKSVRCKFIEVEYEEIVSNPTQFLNNVSQLVGEKITPLPNLLENKVDTKNMHLVAGNPSRYRGKMSLKSDERWKSELTKNEIDQINKHAIK